MVPTKHSLTTLLSFVLLRAFLSGLSIRHVFTVQLFCGKRQQRAGGAGPIWTTAAVIQYLSATTSATTTAWVRTTANGLWGNPYPVPVHWLSGPGTTIELSSTSAAAAVYWVSTPRPTAPAAELPTTTTAATFPARSGTANTAATTAARRPCTSSADLLSDCAIASDRVTRISCISPEQQAVGKDPKHKAIVYYSY
jgi:hypothetical protein